MIDVMGRGSALVKIVCPPDEACARYVADGQECRLENTEISRAMMVRWKRETIDVTVVALCVGAPIDCGSTNPCVVLTPNGTIVTLGIDPAWIFLQ